jgi:hypothetical protein
MAGGSLLLDIRLLMAVADAADGAELGTIN